MSQSFLPLLRKLEKLLGSRVIITSPDQCDKYSGDKWFAAHRPDAVAFPKNTDEVSQILKFANRHKIPVTPRGAGYGYVGGCVPVKGGIALSLEKMKRIREIDSEDFVTVVQSAVKTKTLQDRVEALGLYYPPDPASRADCSIGGNIATNAGGPRCLKYGVTRDYVLGLQVVLANGELLKLGSRTHKNKTGFDLSRFFVGSEGLLGVITEATLKLLPCPQSRAALSIGFPTIDSAVQSIRKIFAAGFLPSALEIADEFTLKAATKRTGNMRLSNCEAHLIVEIDGHESSVKSEIRTLTALVKTLSPRFIDKALGAEACEEIWQLRREFSYSLRDTGLTKLNEDVAVPRSRLTDLFKFAEKLQKKHKMPVACFGHAGDGNIHVNIMVDESAPNFEKRMTAALDELFKQVLKWGGVVTGEHGIGLAKKPWWNEAVPANVRQLHRNVKNALDPKNILNPGKFT